MEIRYTAGLFDGEGGIQINKTRLSGSSNPHHTLKVYLQMTHKTTIENLVQNWGGSISSYQKPKTNWKDQWVWNICGKQAVTFLEAISPYIIIKKPQLEIALDFQALLFQRGYNKRLTTQQIQSREDCFQRLKVCNKRGK